MKELIRERVQYASRQQCCKTHKRPLLLPLRHAVQPRNCVEETFCAVLNVSRQQNSSGEKCEEPKKTQLNMQKTKEKKTHTHIYIYIYLYLL